MTIPVFYRQEQVAKVKSFSPSPQKPELVVNDWSARFPQVAIHSFEPVALSDIKQAHSPKYVEGVMSLKTPNGFGNRSVQVRDSLPYTVGSIVAATKHVAVHGGVAVSPTSGFHHAGYFMGGGFCTFNGLIVAALLAKKMGANHVAIIDCDMHYGDGTQEISTKLKLDWLHHWSAGRFYGDSKKDEKPFLHTLESIMHAVVDSVDLVIYQAGADPHVDDPLGGWLSTEGMKERDHIVFDLCHRYSIPLVWNLAGGYQSPVSKVVKLHSNTMQECINRYM